MLFSRTRPSVDQLAVALKQNSAKKAPDRRPNLSVVETSPAKPSFPVIQDIKDVPTGRYEAFGPRDPHDATRGAIPTIFAEEFALLKTSETTAYLLTAVESVGTHPQFELQRRLKDLGVESITVRPATREIIKAVHAEHRAEEVVKDTKVEALGWALIEEAVDKGTSDIHIETRGSYAQVWFRIHGERIEQPSIAATTATEICNVLYTVHADADNKDVTWDFKTVRDTVIKRETCKGKTIQLRFSSGPIHPAGNFHAVIRILIMDEETIRPIEKIGYTEGQIEAIEQMLTGSHGVVLLVGPTNSGKSTSMQSFLRRTYEMRGDSIKIITIEQPVEYIIKNACQMGVPEGRDDADFTSFLKGTLRQDPDGVMVGEIRGQDDAEHVKNLILAGRKLFSTLHVYEVFAVFARLREIGVPESVLYMEGFISGVVCQRLVPILCPDCSTPIGEAFAEGRIRRALYDRVSRVADLDCDNVRVRGDGCEECKYIGIIGRTPCAEVLVPNATFLELMAQGNYAAAKHHWVSNAGNLNVDGNGVSAVAHAIQKMRIGMIDPAHVESYIGRLIIEPSMPPGSGFTVQGETYPPSLR